MIKKAFFFLILTVLCTGCGKKKEPEVIRPKGDFQMSLPDRSDRQPNGGMLRFTLEGKTMHDSYCVALFTPRGDLFQNDNLQLFNYNPGSDKYPQFLINLDYRESDLQNWQDKKFPLDFLAFTPAPNQVPFTSQGEVKLTKVTNEFVEGKFSGDLINPHNDKSYPIKGEFKAAIRVNS
ncbi:hypothetical protein A2V82_01850 [candidate division KSB1 bacterium RBG_16_48_16]|nr:MAG: hypothetical protein A2V82_01850 [candidate division KSB1 bacterium RBG_16_48_16]